MNEALKNPIPSQRAEKNITVESLAKYVSEIVSKESGNKLGDLQQHMVISRISKRLMELGNLNPSEYFTYLNHNFIEESQKLISALTTHHTFFFREFTHFEYLMNSLPSLIENVKKRGASVLRIYSAACSRGQEVYSLAMFLEREFKKYPGMDYMIEGSDIDHESVNIAKNGVYPFKDVIAIPKIYLEGNWQRGTGAISEFAKIKNHLRSKVKFSVMNLLEPTRQFRSSRYDIVFCRNVFIYFEPQTVLKCVHDFKSVLYPDGILITGLSESLKHLGIEIYTKSPSVYCFTKEKPTEQIARKPKLFPIPASSTSIGRGKVSTSIPSIIPKPIRMLVVDDSKSVVKLLSKIFEKDSDFEYVGCAYNGAEAEEFLKTNEVDAITLDIHMPEVNGVEYLKRNFNSKHPKVVVVSSANRSDTQYAQETLKYGASDFVEKPAFNNIQDRAEEIKNKIKMAFINEGSKAQTQIDNSFQKSYNIEQPDTKNRLFFGTYSDLNKINDTINHLIGNQPPLFLLFEGCANYFPIIQEKLSSQRNVELFDESTQIKSGGIYICDFSRDNSAISDHIDGKLSVACVFGILSGKAEQFIKQQTNFKVLVEDCPGQNPNATQIASDVFPWTSFAHLSTEQLCKK